MFSIAILIGIYSYLIYLLGITSLLITPIIIGVSLIYTTLSGIYLREELGKFKRLVFAKQVRSKNSTKVLILLIFAISGVNLIGALGPETAFDSLWYHLTLPKLFVQSHMISHIPGGLLYYSDMPKHGEMLYVLPIALKVEILAKLIHFSFGILCLYILYRLSNKFLNSTLSFLAVLIFASNIVFMWESTTAYVDLAWTFFQTMALWGFLNWSKTENRNWLYEFSVMLGLAISVKLFALFSIFPFTVMILYLGKRRIKVAAKDLTLFTLISLSVASPYFILSYLNTGNPIYPIFTAYYPSALSFGALNPVDLFLNLFKLFTHAADPISPIYVTLLPLMPLVWKKMSSEGRSIFIYCFVSMLVWLLIPHTGGARFFLPTLPALSFLAVYIVRKNTAWTRLLWVLAIIIALTSIFYRGIASSRYIPVILGYQSKDAYLTNHLNFSYGDFYDTDHFFKNNIGSSDKVLLYGFHNLYYVDFPFIDGSYVKPGERFNFIATQNTVVPSRFSFWHPVYQNRKTGVTLYSIGGASWYY